MIEPKNQDTNYEQQRAALVLAAARKPILQVRQYDAFPNMAIDAYADPDGDCLSEREIDALRKSDCVRLQIPKNVPPADAVRLLRKLLAWVERDAGIPAAPTAAQDLATVTLKAALDMAQGGTF